jgi:hypothetical protein
VTTLALLHSPLTSADVWGRLPDRLQQRGWAVVVPAVTDDDEPPFATRYVARVAMQLNALLRENEIDPEQPLVVLGHSGAGPLLGQIGFARRSAGHPVAGYLFLDAGLPRPARAVDRLDLMALDDEEFADELRQHLAIGGRFPEWDDAALAEVVPDAGDRALLLAGLRPRELDFFTEPLPLPEDWPDAPVGYLRCSAPYDQAAATAGRRGWAVADLELGHFPMLVDPERTAAAIDDLLTMLVTPRRL